ncbi:MAG: MFS transporter [Defluviitaleaceae bacterium]|nr:MFS transporter [Defluviitaleaceae bacterium]
MDTSKRKTAIKILIAGTVLQFFIGILYVWSIFVAPISEHLNWAVESVMLTSSYMLGFFVIGIIIGGKLLTKLDSRTILFIGGMMLAAGIAATPLVPQSHPWLVYLTYGVIGGTGIGMIYNTVLTAAQQWFPNRRGFAIGICVSSFGFSAVVFAPVTEVLVSQIGVINTLYTVSIIIAISVLCLFRLIRLPESSGANREVEFVGRQFETNEIIKTKQFYYMTLALVFGTPAYLVILPALKSLAIDRGLSAAVGTSLVMVAGMGNALGRLLAPIISEKAGRENTLIAITAATAICSLLLIFISGVFLLPVVFIMAFCYGGPAGVNPVLASDYFGLKYIGGNLGAILIGLAISALFIPMLVGFIPSETVRFLVLAILSSIGVILLMLLRTSRKRWLADVGRS